jgi:DeoR/GlpR family transcriptional regulator of sugar metabolism
MATNRTTKDERRRRIVAELQANPTVRISELARLFGVTTETVRRDVDSLSEEGLVSRTYGGAAATTLSREPSLDERHGLLIPERQRIARAAVGCVEDGQVLMIDSGATTAHFARRLAVERQRLTVITNGTGLAAALAVNPSFRVVLCPGDYNPSESGTYGPEVGAFLAHYRADQAFIGAGGLTLEGPNDVSAELCWVKRAMIERASATTLLVDHSKVDRFGLLRICGPEDLARVIGDKPLPGDLAQGLRHRGVELLVAAEPPPQPVSRAAFPA